VSDINIDTDGPRLFGRSTFVQCKLSHVIRLSYAEFGLSTLWRSIQIFRVVSQWRCKIESEAYFVSTECQKGRSQWPRRPRRESAAAGLLGLRVRIPPRAWILVSCECCVLSGRGLCNGVITHAESPTEHGLTKVEIPRSYFTWSSRKFTSHAYHT
jgi:hypothetical protein